MEIFTATFGLFKDFNSGQGSIVQEEVFKKGDIIWWCEMCFVQRPFAGWVLSLK